MGRIVFSRHCAALKEATGSARKAKMDLFALVSDQDRRRSFVGLQGVYQSDEDVYPSIKTYRLSADGNTFLITVSLISLMGRLVSRSRRGCQEDSRVVQVKQRGTHSFNHSLLNSRSALKQITRSTVGSV